MSENIFSKKTSLAAIAFIALDLCVLFLGGFFITKKIISSSSQMVEKNKNLESIRQSWQQTLSSQKELQLFEAELAKIDDSFISLDNPQEFIIALENLAAKTGNIFEISPMPAGDKSDKNNPKFLLFQINLTGNWNNFMHFLRYLENMSYAVSVESLQISKASVAGAGGQIAPDSLDSIINIKINTR